MSMRLAWPILAGLLSAAAFSVPGAYAACSIPATSCYPFRIEADDKETVLLEVVPNNVQTAATYRVCLCPPAKKVGLVFDFEGKRVDIGSVEAKSSSAICRDFRIATARKSRLLVTRAQTEGPIEGCYQ
jgi:hypothetical protein